MKTMPLSEAVEKNANEIPWYPDYMRNRLVDWTRSLDWDWVVNAKNYSLCRILFGTAKAVVKSSLPKKTGCELTLEWKNPESNKCPQCGGIEFCGETDVLDTWMDSSITCAVHAGWPDRADWKHLFPASMHPSGTDIIRTWAYYLMVRHRTLFNERPFDSVLINGMVLGADGRKNQ